MTYPVGCAAGRNWGRARFHGAAWLRRRDSPPLRSGSTVSPLVRFPGAMGLNELAEIGDMDLQVACFSNPETPVCEDAEEQGRL